jgi:hypothetical protein
MPRLDDSAGLFTRRRKENQEYSIRGRDQKGAAPKTKRDHAVNGRMRPAPSAFYCPSSDRRDLKSGHSENHDIGFGRPDVRTYDAPQTRV